MAQSKKEIMKILEKEFRKVEGAPARVYVWDFIKQVRKSLKHGTK